MRLRAPLGAAQSLLRRRANLEPLVGEGRARYSTLICHPRDVAFEEPVAQDFDAAARVLLISNHDPEQAIGPIGADRPEQHLDVRLRDATGAFVDKNLFPSLQLVDQLGFQELESLTLARMDRVEIRTVGTDEGMSRQSESCIDTVENAAAIRLEDKVLGLAKAREARLQGSEQRAGRYVAPAQQTEGFGA